MALAKEKKADLTANQLITIIILIVSFIIILLFFFMLNLRKTISEESCRNSVVMKTIPIFGKLVQFKCQTQDAEVTGKTAEEVYQNILDLQSGCFFMMGEGKLDIRKGTCAICDVASFDDAVKKKFSLLSQEDYYKLLENTKVPGEDFSYLYYFYNQHYWETFKTIMQEKDKIFPVPFDTSKKYAMIYAYYEENGFRIGLIPYDEEHIKNLECKRFATTA